VGQLAGLEPGAEQFMTQQSMIQYENASAVWQASHGWLRPDRKHLRMRADQYLQCPYCRQQEAVRIRSHLRFGAREWCDQGSVLHCTACGEVSLLHSDRAAIERTRPDIVGQPLTAVEARLWSAKPTFLNIEPTTRCNFECWYCVGRSMKQEDIKVEDFAKVLDNFPTLETVALVGEGEPLLHKGYFDMVKMARARGLHVMMISNGSAFSESVVRKICESGITYISISIDSISADNFGSSRIKGDLNRVLDGIEKLRRYRDEHGYQYPKIGLKGTLFQHTEHELLPIVEMAKARGVEVFESFQPLNPHKNYVRIYPKEQLKELTTLSQISTTIQRDSSRAVSIMQSIQAFCEEEGIALDKNGNGNGLRPNCDEEWIYALLSGDVTPCCQIKTPMSPTWNLFNHDIQSILDDQQYQNTRFNLFNGLFPDYCDGCHKTARR
jgi:MoaA/NifB/PqqE/SkfB family radical SAM enzyme